jgi:hypothetical protein
MRVVTVVLAAGKLGKYRYGFGQIDRIIPRMSGSGHWDLPFDRLAGHDSEQF